MNRNNRSVVFKNSIKAVFDSWSALKIAIQHAERPVNPQEFAIWLIDAVEDYFYLNDDLMADEVAEFLEDILNEELDTVVDDGSLFEVGGKLCTYFRMCLNNQEQEVSQSIQQLPAANAPVQVQSAPVDDDSDDDELD